MTKKNLEVSTKNKSVKPTNGKHKKSKVSTKLSDDKLKDVLKMMLTARN